MEFSNYVESRPNAAGTLDGSEILVASKNGDPVRLTTQDLVDEVAGGGGTSIPYGETSGTNTYTIAATPAVTAYTDPMLLHIRVGNSSTSLVTLNFDGLGAKKLFDTAGTQAQDGYLKAGVDYLVVYNAALDGAAGGFTVVNELVHGVMNLRGTFVSAGGGVWPTGAGSGPSGGIRHGDVFVMGDADTLGAKVVNAGDFITTTVDAPGQTDSNWFVIPGPASLALKANLASPALTGTPTAPTAAGGTNTTQVATTAFVQAAVSLNSATPSTAGGTITLDMNSQQQRMHVGSASFSAAKIIAMSNTTGSLQFQFIFEVTNVAAVLTVPADWLMSSANFNGTDWTPPSTGKYVFGGMYDGTNWYVNDGGPYA